MELPGIANRLRPKQANVFRLTYRRRQATDTWEHFKDAAARHERDPADLWAEVGVTNEELATRVLN